jgi:purine-binding chemotaxis protein CheW
VDPGVINLRGKVVPICDLAMRLGIHHDHPDTAKIAVVDSSTPARTETIDTADSDYIDGVAKLGERLPVLLNADRLLEEINQAALPQLEPACRATTLQPVGPPVRRLSA